MRAATSCRTCGTEPLENAGFCHRCGSPVAESATHAEYKQVTVLFADVVHSMDIAAAVGAVLRLRALLARAHGDEAAYRDYRDRYRAMAIFLGFEGHMKWAEEMP